MNSKSMPLVQHQSMTAEDVAAVNPNIAVDEDHFNKQTVSGTTLLLPWFATLNSGTAVITGAAGGKLLITTATTTDDAIVNIQKNGEAYKLAVGKRVSFVAKKVQIDDVSLAGAFLGLAITNTAVLTANAAKNASDMVGFLWDGTNLFGIAVKDSVALTLGVNKINLGALADATDVDLAFHFDGAGNIQFFVDGVLTGTSTDAAAVKTYLPDDEELTPTIVAQEISAVARTMLVCEANGYQEV